MRNKHEKFCSKRGLDCWLKVSDQTLPIHIDLAEIFAGLKHHQDGRVFRDSLRGVLKPDTVRLVLRREVITALKNRFPTPAREIGFEHATPHSFRHFFTSQAFVDGASASHIRDWLGHQDSKMVDHYRHLADEESQRRMQGIDFLGEGNRSGG